MSKSYHLYLQVIPMTAQYLPIFPQQFQSDSNQKVSYMYLYALSSAHHTTSLTRDELIII